MIYITYPDILRACISYIVLVIIDAMWLPFASYVGIYPPMPTDVNIIFAILAWMSLSVALSCGKVTNIKQAAIFGAFVGAVGYSTWNFTEASLHKDWKTISVVADLTYGILLCAGTSALVYKFNTLI